ncbi:hypothetical protein ACOSQ2_017353 [Xanthoceras sorbifolium]
MNLCTWTRVKIDELSTMEQEHIFEAWKIDSKARHVDSFLDEEWLLSCDFIDSISCNTPRPDPAGPTRGALPIFRTFKIRKLVEKVKKRMQGRAFDAKGKGKAAEALKRPRRNTPRFNQGTIAVPNAFLKTGPSKRARM